MCGIAGIIGNKPLNIQYIEKMISIIEHRGPDSQGKQILNDGKVLLGHRRLSILDLSESGKQPMSYLNGRYWITYNGEIYNYLELRRELESLSYKFNTNTDTEVIMAAYDYWGKDCLNKFNGMWAFIIVDTVKDIVFVARDRFGVKPLYFYRTREYIVFASEIKQFFTLPDWRAIVDNQMAYDYLCWGLSDHTDRTMFKGVYQLRRGEAGTISLNDKNLCFNIYEWYKIKTDNLQIGFHEAVQQFRELLIDSIRLRMRADVKIGSCLSGGLDSSSIVCIVNKLLKENGLSCMQKTVSAKAEFVQYDESKFISEVLDKKSIDGIYTLPTFEGLLENIEKITWYQDEPFGSTSIYAQWCVFETAAQNKLKVMLDGQGADEQLAGYHLFFNVKFAELFRAIKWLKLLDEVLACKQKHNYGFFFMMKAIISQTFPEYLLNIIRKNYNHIEIAPSWLNIKKLDVQPKNSLNIYGNKTSSIKDLSMAQLFSNNLQKLLHWEDRNSMAHSIESRLPFLDYRLVEFVINLPDEYKIDNGETKRILRESMIEYLPEKIRKRHDKMGFVTPEEVWFFDNKEIFMKKLKEAIDISEGILTNDALAYFDKVQNKDIPFSMVIWRMINFGVWKQVCFQ